MRMLQKALKIFKNGLKIQKLYYLLIFKKVFGTF